MIRFLFQKYIKDKSCRLIKINCTIRFEKIGKFEKIGIIKIEKCLEIRESFDKFG